MTDILNPDLSLPAIVKSREIPWQSSPASGVERKYLERDTSGEVARASTIVRFAAGSRFPEHVHAKGEEYLVLEGTFSDNAGDFPAGSYVRNPPGSKHSPHSDQGCTILVKLRQMTPDEEQHVVVDTKEANWSPTGFDGMESQTLYKSTHDSETVALERWSAGVMLSGQVEGGEEFYVLEGHLKLDGEPLPHGTWVRLPSGQRRNLEAAEPSVIWVKRGHLDTP